MSQIQLLSTVPAAGEHMAHAISTSEERSLAERELVSWGGYGLQISPCPEGTSSCGDSCCPSSYKCSSAGNHKDNFSPTEAICCPTDADCAATVKVVPACADSSWGLYHAIAEFCCPVDYVGVYPEGGTGLMCLSSSLPIPSDKLAGSVRHPKTCVLMNDAWLICIQVKQNTSTKAAAATPSPGSKTTSASSGTVTSGAVTSDAVSSDTATSDQNSQSPTGTTGNSTKSGGLSKNATIAIAVLATALGLLSIFIIGYCLWRRKRRSTRQSQSSADPPNTQSTNAYAHSSTTEKIPAAQPATAKPGEVHVNELLGKNVLYPPGTTELETSHRAELYDTGRVQ
ncbi:hypothetical protein ONS95_002383 [Cadophora gregata]|uniref:uncharacterized protein n=1 Tax=Cadophora gregata TaxID=51156 RepID=UPI0026DD5B1C|nr:uncharacterized protein ONS95_002383 [Cadophora gregata]KAK0109704.1 hypothetical protein ONS95_002383 [Cadophora gregata]